LHQKWIVAAHSSLGEAAAMYSPNRKRQIARKFGRQILQLRCERGLPRLAVVQRTGINWKRIRALEEGRQVARLDEVIELARLYGVDPIALVEKSTPTRTLRRVTH
jgi:hypothetical protein